MRRSTIVAAAALVAAPVFAATPSLKQIMANPDWIGPPVEQPYWGSRGHVIYYSLKHDGDNVRDLYRVNPQTGTSSKVGDRARADADGPPVFDRNHQYAAFVRHGDIFIRNLGTGHLRQVTRTPEHEFAPQWSADGQTLQYRHDNQWYSYDMGTGLAAPVATLKTADNPQDTSPGQLERLQLHLFKTLRTIKHDQDAQQAQDKALDAADSTRTARPYYLGKNRHIVDTELSPNGRWMLVVTRPAGYDAGKHPEIMRYVTRSGYTRTEKARTYVGRNKPAPQSFLLLDLAHHKQYTLSTDNLPGIHDDPLAALRKQRQAQLRKEGHDKEAAALDAPKTRPVALGEIVSGESGHYGVTWSDDGSQLGIELRATDNKDRWIVTVDFRDHTLVTQNRLHDDAWINWSFNDFGFLRDNRTLWYLSEASGYSQLYIKPLHGKAKQLTSGHFEVSNPQLSPDGRWFYVTTNKVAPYSYDIYRIRSHGGALHRVTHFQAIDGFEISPRGHRLAVLHSTPYIPPQLAVIDGDGSHERDLTDTRTARYKAMHWIAPQFVKVPSTHGAGVIYAKMWKAPGFDASKKHPAVIFVHGAGYLQDVTKGWSYYFREQMFNNMLAREGYVVIDMDYRASAGYGRDWRTAIYQHMGHPELQDLLDGKRWMVKTQHVDPKRVGIYGGSYGGFMTEMALLRAPGQFAAGAALRPPSDWTSYNDGYTSDILNDPQLDPKAYRVSSPIEYAKNLQDPLLICHGLIDNNVMPSDSIRLYQRFIELHKKHFWISLYPLERHAFEHADDWYDEYRRIHALFTRYVKPVH